jgi:hypothetical protein
MNCPYYHRMKIATRSLNFVLEITAYLPKNSVINQIKITPINQPGKLYYFTSKP